MQIAQHRVGRRLTYLAPLVGLALVTVFVVLAVGWRVSGGRWLVVETPSMGTAAPVGTLVLTRPTQVADLKVGDVVTYRTPPPMVQTFTHRVIAIHGDYITTRGDINGAADPWRTTNASIVGRVVAIIPRLGWLLRMLPLLVLGSIVILALRLMLRSGWRTPWCLVGFPLLVSVALWLFKPLVNLVLITSNAAHGRVTASVVSTGLLPIRVSAKGGTHVDLALGHVGQVRGVPHNSAGHVPISEAIHLPWWGWVLLLLICLIPTLCALTAGFVSGPEGEREEEFETGPEPVGMPA